jgi:hypothetical protein
MNINDNFSTRYLDGWGEGEESLKLIRDVDKNDINGLLRVLAKFSKRDKEFFRSSWRKRYLALMESLLEEQDQPNALNDGYLKKVDKALGNG